MGTTLPAARTNDDRLGTLAGKEGKYTAKCDGCPEGGEAYSWACGTTAPGTFVWRPLPDDEHEPGQTACNIPYFQDWIGAWQDRTWNAGWFCAGCLTHIFDARPSDILSILERDTLRVYPPRPARNTAKQREVARDLLGADQAAGTITNAAELDQTDQATVARLAGQAPRPNAAPDAASSSAATIPNPYVLLQRQTAGGHPPHRSWQGA